MQSIKNVVSQKMNALLEYINTTGHDGKKKTKISIGTEFSNRFKDACSVFSYHQSQVKTKTRRLLLLLYFVILAFLQF